MSHRLCCLSAYVSVSVNEYICKAPRLIVETSNALAVLIPYKHECFNKHPNAASVAYGSKAYMKKLAPLRKFCNMTLTFCPFFTTSIMWLVDSGKS